MPSLSTSTSRLHGVLLLFLILEGMATVYISTRHNAFPYTYHPDEDTKVHQIVTGKRNFFHPLLLLTTTNTVYQSGLVQKNPLNAAITGRWVSATFTALAIMTLTFLAWRWGGWPSALGAALLLITNPLGFELAHYFKEDPALLFGLAVTFLALDFFWKTPTAKAATFLGIAIAMAISGKYLGAVVLIFALPLLFIHARKNGRLVLWFLLGLILTIVAVNWPLLRHWVDFSHGLGREMDGATGGHRGLSRDVPHAYYLAKLQEIMPFGIWLGLTFSCGIFLWQWKKWPTSQILTLVFPFFFIALLSFSPKTATRYALPATMLFSFLAGVAPGLVWRAPFPRRFRVLFSGFATIAVFAGAAANWPVSQKLYADFSTDARQGLREWLDENTPPDAVIAQDERVDLLAASIWKNRQVLDAEFVADLGSISEMQARGISYVAVSRQTYQRFLSGKFTPHSEEKADFDRRQVFYKSLLASGKPVWQSPTGAVIYLQPGLQLYRILP